jgi:hypothetical protein
VDGPLKTALALVKFKFAWVKLACAPTPRLARELAIPCNLLSSLRNVFASARNLFASARNLFASTLKVLSEDDDQNKKNKIISTIIPKIIYNHIIYYIKIF